MGSTPPRCVGLRRFHEEGEAPIRRSSVRVHYRPMKHVPLEPSRRRVPLPGTPGEACPRFVAGVLDEARRPESLWVTGEDAATEPLRRSRCRHRSRDLSGNLLQVLPVFVVGLVVLASCGGETPTGVDRTAPGSVEDLHLIVSEQTSVTVGWTTPGDDGGKGQASGYDLRYGVVPPQVDWDVAKGVEAVPLVRWRLALQRSALSVRPPARQCARGSQPRPWFPSSEVGRLTALDPWTLGPWPDWQRAARRRRRSLEAHGGM